MAKKMTEPKLREAGKAIIARLTAGEKLAAQPFGHQPSGPFWESDGKKPNSMTVPALFRHGLIGWEGERPRYPQYGRLVLRQSATLPAEAARLPSATDTQEQANG